LTGEEPVTVKLPCTNPDTPNKHVENTFILEPLNVLKQVPSKRTFNEILNLISEEKDWKIIPDLIREYTAAGRKMRQPMISKLIRLAAQHQQYGLVIELFRSTSVNDLRINTQETALELMLLCLHRAVSGSWSERDSDKALRHAETLFYMMQDPHHGPTTNIAARNPSKRPQIVAFPLALAAVRAVKFSNGEDVDGKVQRYAKQFLQAMQGTHANNIQVDLTKGAAANSFLWTWAPAWMGVQMAAKVVKDVRLLQQLNEVFERTLQPLVLQAQMVLEEMPLPEEGSLRGLQVYSDVKTALAEKEEAGKGEGEGEGVVVEKEVS
jgi:hypothetical protein